MNKKTTITNLVGMKQEVEFTELEQELIGVIDNFILWNTTESDIGLAEEYMANEHVDYNEFFKIDKSKYNREDKIMNARKIKGVINRIGDDISALNHLLKSQYKKREKLELNGYDEVMQDQYGHEVIDVDVYHIDLEIESINGNIGAYEDCIKRLNMLKESINK